MVTDLLAIVALVLVNGLLAGAEIAVVTARRSKLLDLAAAGDDRAGAVLALRARPEWFLATVQVGITAIGIAAGALGEASFAEPIAISLRGLPVVGGFADELAFAVVVAIASFLSVVIGELVPKSLALRAAERYATIIARPMHVLAWIARPLVALLTASSNLLLRPFGDRTTFTETHYSSDELQRILSDAARGGELDTTASQIASRALDLADLTAEDVMVPRQQVVVLWRHSDQETVRRVLLEHAHSRMPVCEGTIDNVVGYVTVKDLMSFAFEQRLIVLEDAMRPAFFAPETQRAIDLLNEMRRRRVPFAIIVDEQGGMSGIVTLEDLVEELVGDILDEHASEQSPLLSREASGDVLVSGMAAIRDINRELGTSLPEPEGVTTVAGLAIAVAGKMPERGQILRVATDTVLEVTDVTMRRVRWIRVRYPHRELHGSGERLPARGL